MDMAISWDRVLVRRSLGTAPSARPRHRDSSRCADRGAPDTTMPGFDATYGLPRPQRTAPGRAGAAARPQLGRASPPIAAGGRAAKVAPRFARPEEAAGED